MPLPSLAMEVNFTSTHRKRMARFSPNVGLGGRTHQRDRIRRSFTCCIARNRHRSITMGAREMDNLTRESDFRKNPAAMLALSWHYLTDGKGSKDMVILPYKDSLELFAKYLQQLIMESLGKEKDLAGNMVHRDFGVRKQGSTINIAYVQQLRKAYRISSLLLSKFSPIEKAIQSQLTRTT